MNKLFFTITPSRFKGIVVLWTILGLMFTTGFLYGAFFVIRDLLDSNFKFKSFPFFIIASLLLCVVFPLVFVLYHYSRYSLKQQPASLLKWLFIMSIPLLLYFWVTTLPSMRALDIVYEIVFFSLHITVFLKFPGYFNALRPKS